MIGTQKETKVVWHEQNVNKLAKLWKKGMKASEIVKEFPGATRNGILGKIHRMGLSRKKKEPVKPTPKRAAPQRKNPMIQKPIVIPREVIVTAPQSTVNFSDLNETTCRSVLGYSMQGSHRLPFYCGNPKVPFMSFCPYHCEIYYRKG